MNYDELARLMERNRSVRRFDESRPVGRERLMELVGLTRYCASGRNMQPLKYMAVYEAEECGRVFPLLKWAGYLTDWDGPADGERPRAYLVQCLDTDLAADCMCDDGIQLEAITLGACAMGLSACIIKAFNVGKLMDVLKLPSRFKPLYVVALGYGVERVRIVEMDEATDDGYKYYREADGTHYVPKRRLESLIIDGE